MIDFTMTDEQRAIVDNVRRFVRDEIVPAEAGLDADCTELPPEDRERLAARVAEMGLALINVPVEYGGAGLDVVTQTLMAFEMTQHKAGLYAPCYNLFGTSNLAQLYDATDDQKRRYLLPTLAGEKRGFFGLSEPSGGSDPARSIRTVARRDGDDWIVSGAKLWISGADRADYGLIFARTGEGRRAITAFIVDTDMPGFEVRRIVHTLRTTAPATEIALDEVRVPDANRLGAEGGGFDLAGDRLNEQRIPYSAQCLGVAQAAHRMAIDYAKTRETFGQPLAARGGIQWMLVENEIELRSARLLVLEAAIKADRGEPFRTEAAVAKIAATEGAGRIVDRAMQIHGGMGVAKDLPLERWWRELRIRRIGEGPTEVQKYIIARELLGKVAA